MKKEKLLWKTIPESFGNHGHKWQMKKWFKIDGKLELCSHGFHASEKILDAIGYIKPGWVCCVKVRGESVIGDDKSCWSEMMVVERKEWTKEMSVELAIYAAELVIDIYEKKYPGDDRPRNAIEAAKKYLHREITADAAHAAAHAAHAAAYAADAAAHAAAYAAAHAARAAADAADAAYAAAYAADAAARAAAYAADAAARAADAAARADKEKLLIKIEKKIKSLVGYK